ncbi:MAG: N-acetylmuramoyl-L-alanine amidase [Desulfosalsimonadaceae bacterium]
MTGFLPVQAAGEKPLVVIDAGHGGPDKGVKAVGGSLEKDVALEMAEALEKALANECRTTMTRTGDYELSPQKRASIANHKGADLFISIHAGGFFRTGRQCWELYYFASKNGIAGQEGTAGDCCWYRVQMKHLKASRHFAGILQSHLQACPGVESVRATEAPLLLLEGLDMPGIVVETGYLTNPALESRLNEAEFLRDAAGCIQRGIAAFFREH